MRAGCQVRSLVSVGRGPAIAKGGLPGFSIDQYWRTVTAGARIEEWKVVREMAEYREERERKTTLFVTPGLSPLAMGPIVESSYWESRLRSDLRYKKLFPNDVARRARMKDLDGEVAALWYYTTWLRHELAEGPNLRHQFYVRLEEEVKRDEREVRNEWDSLRNMATPLGIFEFLQLDQDGGTTSMVKALEMGFAFSHENDGEVQARYGPLLREYPKLWRFERRFSHILVSKELVCKHWNKVWLEGTLHIYGDEAWTKHSIFSTYSMSRQRILPTQGTEATVDGSQDDSDGQSSGEEDAEQLRDDEVSPSASDCARN